MRIVVLAYGSRGDIEPYLALACGLQAAGHAVCLAANPNFQTLSQAYGMKFHPIGVDSKALTRESKTQRWLSSRSLVTLALRSFSVARPDIPRLLAEIEDACNDAEALIYHAYTLPMGYYFGRAFGLNTIPASIYPVLTATHPALPLNLNRELGLRFNMLSQKVVDQFTWQVFYGATRRHFQGQLKVSLLSPYRKLAEENIPVLCCYSPTLLPAPPDLPANVTICGSWHLPPPPGWTPTADLIKFLSIGPPPIYVGFGSMGDPRMAAETGELVREALKMAGCRGVIASGWSGLGEDEIPSSDILTIDQAPHSWLLPKMSAVVHHGGVGTTGSGLKAGLPNIVIPHFSDQFFWGKRVAELGAGPRPIARRHLTSAWLASAIRQSLDSPETRSNAAAIGRKMKQEDGLGLAVRLVNQYLSA